MFQPKLKNCLVACSSEKIQLGQCSCYNDVMNESGPHNGSTEFEAYLEAFCIEVKYTREDIFKDPALLETVWEIYKSINKL